MEQSMVFKHSKLRRVILLAFGLTTWGASAAEFNTDVLDAEDLQNIDISRFSVAGYVPPGDYVLTVWVNGLRLGAPRDISVYEKSPSAEQRSPFVCIPTDMLQLIGLTHSAKRKLTTLNEGRCLDLSLLSGAQTQVELSTLSLKITIPQMWMEYRDPYWIPPALWEEGVNGGFIDFNANASATKEKGGTKRVYLSTNGTMGINTGAWRFRGDYNGSYQKQRGGYSPQETHQFDFSRLYAFTSLTESAAILTLGENYFYSDIFDAWQYSGVSLESDDRMLPPKLVGYAPEIIGVANTNATVIVRSQDRVISETLVPPGPFRIQTLESGIRGILDVTVREENGEEKTFTVSTASLPYLTRPGRLIYKLVGGKTRYDSHHLTGKPVIGGEFSYGVSNAWSLYGGSQLNGYYQALAVGLGRDLFSVGAISVDITQSFADLEDKKRQGRSYRVNYAKSFDDLRTDITFAGYRFADKDYRTLTQFSDEARTGITPYAPKTNYQIYLNKYFEHFNISLNYQYSTYWQNDPQTQYGMYASTHLNLPALSQHGASLSLSATRTERDNGFEDDAINLYLTVPLYTGHSLTFSELYSRSSGHNQFNHNVGYSGYNTTDNYSLNMGYHHGQNMDNQTSLSGFYSRDLSQANISANASYVPHEYRSVGASINSGITATAKGVALHRSANGDTRLMIDTSGISGVPLDNGVIKTNAFGLAVIPNVNSYRKSTASINTSKLPDNLETLTSTTDITLTKGAIGYRHLTVMKGEKLFAILSLENGKKPPFGASVRNADNRELGIVGEDGVTWLVGVSAQESLFVYWDNQKQCRIKLPETFVVSSDMLLLPCLRGKL
ncbi:TPA: fimbria/pilus outer membrane usher protein [Providencia stuartii]|uniref:fimbria/pilus outer membrane usher protein n=1 Tax=Providencia TaxID=586 RepID=UPI00073BB78E|nr:MULTISPECIES: fimbria/pilus outer membrane usher protein [Providencia]KSX96618.1 fimbrial assembly protein [Providencia stuartii]MBN5561437.1 fimbria/pilus outer membrane usher protein [Providencia stuartii]MBN5602087.1 fimbria/pilus outer membrane usher protein [Providencia stuartii]MBN5606133.1 fimbria/pilus outer membrane usher protein [Providencia stuartii]MCL8325131.1 fimbria/pilus outer membrane usher protein [Providencia thailandensis]